MDEIDLLILKELQEDARKPLSEISQNINLSLPAVSERIRKLERSRVIERYTAVLNPERFNKTLICYCFLSLQGKSMKTDRQFYEFIRGEPDIISCQCLTGQYEYIIKIMTESTNSLEKLLARMRHDTLVQHTNTFVVLSTVKDLPSIPPDISDKKEIKKQRKAKYA